MNYVYKQLDWETSLLLILVPLLTSLHCVRGTLNYLIHVQTHNKYKLLLFQTLSLPYKSHIQYTLVHDNVYKF